MFGKIFRRYPFQKIPKQTCESQNEGVKHSGSTTITGEHGLLFSLLCSYQLYIKKWVRKHYQPKFKRCFIHYKLIKSYITQLFCPEYYKPQRKFNKPVISQTLSKICKKDFITKPFYFTSKLYEHLKQQLSCAHIFLILSHEKLK